MRERITVQQATVDDSTGEPSRTWTDWLTNEPAAYMPTAGGETIRGRQLSAEISAVFTVRYRAGYSPQMRVVHNGQTYGVVYVKPVDGGRRFLELQCKGSE